MNEIPNDAIGLILLLGALFIGCMIYEIVNRKKKIENLRKKLSRRKK